MNGLIELGEALLFHAGVEHQGGQIVGDGFDFRILLLIHNLQVGSAVAAAFGFHRRLLVVQRPVVQVAALLAVAALDAYYVPLSFAQVAVQIAQPLSGADLHDAGDRHRAAHRAELALFAVFGARFPGIRLAICAQ